MESNSSDYNTIDEYIALFPEDIQKILNQIRAVIRSAALEAEEKISYRIPTFVLKGNLVHFAAYKHHIGFYPTSSAIAYFKDQLAGYEISKGTVRFPLDQPVPYELIRQITAFRVKEILEKAEVKEKK